MKQITLFAGVAVVGLGAVNWLSGGAPAPPEKAAHRAADLCEKLQRTISLDKPIENAPLKDVLEFLSDKYEVTFVVDIQAFDRDRGNKNVEDTMVRLPKMPGVRLRTVLRHLLDQVSGTALVRGDHLEITTNDRQMVDAFADSPIMNVAFPPTVNVSFASRQLEQALAALADQSGVNVVLDPRIPDRDKLLVRVQLLNAPVDTAIRVVAELAGQKAVELGSNIFYVTTAEHAKVLRDEQKANPTRWNTPPPPAPQKATPEKK